MTVAPEPTWPIPPEGGWTADDLDRLPNLPPHTELIDGSLVFVSPQSLFHLYAIRLLEYALFGVVPSDMAVVREMTVTIGRRDRPEPDLAVVRRDSVGGARQTTFRPEDVVLAVEVVSPDSEQRDREVKPRKYAGAGFPHYWRVENEQGELAVHVFEREDTTGTYVPMGIHRKQLALDLPFPIEIDLTDPQRWL
ncbi:MULTISPECIES: Uma2 family endonuclease [Kitasatospora]|uniref:Uma2 family endonuclease n=1 Tax=Kitasatospora cinereorecta TaxID=285560 RepID=A0ABW0VEF6_9ACTN|nr:Uma2 family endonuclease [Kitasatospora paracochleata]